ncbi:MAG: DNA mismatch repair protein MutS2 [Candidatus Paceibacteria bacterium]|jgi:DNA mismatch repair protein MutS2
MEQSSDNKLRRGAERAARRRQVAREGFADGSLELDKALELYAEFAHSSLGRRMLLEAVPLEEAQVREAMARFAEVQLLERAKDPFSLGGVTDPLPIIEAAHDGPLDEAQLASLRGLLSANERLQAWFKLRAQDTPALSRCAADLPDLTALWDRLSEVIDERSRVLDTASPALGRLRREVRELATRIDGTLRKLAGGSEIRNHLTDSRVHLRGGRYCLAVKAKASGRVKGILHDRSQSEQTAFIEPRDVIELSNRLADARHDERRELTRILTELARDVMSNEESLRLAGEGLGKIELAVIGIGYSEVYTARMPMLPGDGRAGNGLVLRGARHPLLLSEQRQGRLDCVVPIDLRLGEEFDMLIITGPNTGGKTLALKTAGLLALLTQLGLPIPVSDGSVVPLYDGIAADIGDEQEISQSLSTFSSHVMRIQAGLERATSKTLVLLDELGGGTDPEEGAALGEALLEVLLVRGAPTLVSTHLGRLKEFAFRNARVENACTEFDLESLAPCYHVLVGVPGDSAALVIAERLGLDSRIVARANQRLERKDGEVTKLLADVREVRTEAERARGSAESQMAEAAETRRELAEEKKDIDRSRDLLEAEAQRGLEERVRGARSALERARALLPQLSSAQRIEMEVVLDDLDNALGGASLTQRRSSFLDSMKKGDLVYLPRYKQRCSVHKVRKDIQEVVVKLGQMKLTVSFDEVTLYDSL